MTTINSNELNESIHCLITFADNMKTLELGLSPENPQYRLMNSTCRSAEKLATEAVKQINRHMKKDTEESLGKATVK